MQKMIPTLTDRQRYWLEHVQACEAAGKTIVEYAAAHEFCAQDMYAGKSVLVKKGVLATAHPTRFQRVQVMDAVASNQWRIGLPNGVSVSFAGKVDAHALNIILNVSASLE
jgi:hypothetical protein